MKQRPLNTLAAIALVFVCLTYLPLNSGCALFNRGATTQPVLTPKQQVFQSEKAYNAVLETLNTARALGKIGPETALKIETYRAQAARALDAMDQAIELNSSTAFNIALAAFNSALDQLIAEQAKVKP